MAISLEGGEVIYFELGEAGALQEMDKKEFGGEVTAPHPNPRPEERP